LGFGSVEAHIDALSEYVIQECAMFYVYLCHFPEVIEAYPGEQLFVKDRLFSGLYSNEVCLPNLPYPMVYWNVQCAVSKPENLESQLQIVDSRDALTA
jgi:hypothetical protein